MKKMILPTQRTIIRAPIWITTNCLVILSGTGFNPERCELITQTGSVPSLCSHLEAAFPIGAAWPWGPLSPAIWIIERGLWKLRGIRKSQWQNLSTIYATLDSNTYWMWSKWHILLPLQYQSFWYYSRHISEHDTPGSVRQISWKY